MLGNRAKIDPEALETIRNAARLVLNMDERTREGIRVTIKTTLLTEDARERLEHSIHEADAALDDAEHRN